MDGWLSTQLWQTQTPGPCLSRLHYSIWNLHGCIKQTNRISNSTKWMTLGILQLQTYWHSDSLHSYQIWTPCNCWNSPWVSHHFSWSHYKIYTNHKNLTFANFNTDCVRCWQLIVEEYGPEIVYLPGVHNIVANFLSRHPISMDSINKIHCIDKIFPMEDNDSFPLDFTMISSINKQTFAFNESNNPTITMKLASLVTLW